MKSIKLISIYFLCFFFSINQGVSQKSLSINSGIQISRIQSKINVRSASADSLDNLRKNFLAYTIGFDYLIPTPQKNLSIKIGTYFQRIGTKDFIIENETNKDFKLSMLSIPLGLEYSLQNKLYFDLAYSFNYSIRRNQNILAARLGEFLTEESFIYNNFTHGLKVGLGYRIKNIDFSIDLQTNISKLWDSEDFFDTEMTRWTGAFKAISFSIGHYITE